MCTESDDDSCGGVAMRLGVNRLSACRECFGVHT